MGEQTVRCKAVCGKMKPDELGGTEGTPRGEGGTVEGLEGREGPPGGASGQCKGPGGDAPGVPEGGLARLREGGGRGGVNGRRDWRGLVPLSHSAFLPDPDGDAQEGLCRRWHVT